jgi:hypothetical protein
MKLVLQAKSRIPRTYGTQYSNNHRDDPTGASIRPVLWVSLKLLAELICLIQGQELCCKATITAAYWQQYQLRYNLY